jgi:hypothetical protein
MDPERENYADYGSPSRLPTPAALAGLVVIGLGAVLIVAAFITLVVVAHHSKLAP